MDNSYIYFYYLAITIGIAYVLLILFQILAFFQKDRKIKQNYSEEIGLSIVVPFRNEAKSIGNLIKDLNGQVLGNKSVEVVWVNDGSEDNGVQIIEAECLVPHKIITSAGHGKKFAIDEGVKAAKFDIIATLDADVSINSQWFELVMEFFAQMNNGFLILPIITKNEKGLWGNFEALDVLSLTGTTMSWAKSVGPILCNGANLAFRKKIYDSYRSLDADSSLVSGDDVFFLNNVKKHKPNAIGCIMSEASVAQVNTFNSFKDLVNQRVRWISKVGFYRDFLTAFIAWIVFINYLLILVLSICSLFYLPLIKLFFILFCSKFFIDFLYLFLLARKFNKLKLLPWYPLSALLQFIFVPLVFLTSKVAPFEWKGRKYRR